MSGTVTLPRPPRQGVAGDALVLRLYQRCEWKELALMLHGFTPERLIKLARKIANDALRLRGATLQDRFEDLVSRLQIAGMEAAWKYDPLTKHASYGSNGGDPFQSYLSDIMDKRVVDFYRSKAEGWGDRRYGNDNMYDLSDDPDPADHDVDFEYLVDERRRARWQQAADSKGMTISQFVVSAIDVVTDDVVGVAA